MLNRLVIFTVAFLILTSFFRFRNNISSADIVRLESVTSSEEAVSVAKTLAQKKGARKTLSVLENVKLAPAVNRHKLGHAVGGILYLQEKLAGVTACNGQFRNGCNHEIVSKALARKGEKVTKKLVAICNSSREGLAGVSRCYHGLGHGVMAYSSYDFEKSVELCGRLGTPALYYVEAGECLGGAMMEFNSPDVHNEQAYRQALADYLSADDILYPCNEQYIPASMRASCIHYVPQLLVLRAGTGSLEDKLEKLISQCEKVADKFDRRDCLKSLGTAFILRGMVEDIKEINMADGERFGKTIAQCAIAKLKEDKRWCIAGAVETILFGGGKVTPSEGPARAFCTMSNELLDITDCFSDMDAIINSRSGVKSPSFFARLRARFTPEYSFAKKNPGWGQRETNAYFRKIARQKSVQFANNLLKHAPLPPNVEIHVLGHVIYDVFYEKEGAEGISSCPDDFRNACSHSIVIGMFTDFGESALSQIDAVCRKAPGGKAAYTMCYHGLGHGILAYYNYDLVKAVGTCQKTGTKERKNAESIECIGGAVMELVGGGFHDRDAWEKQRANFITPEDLLSPCNRDFMPDDARGMCYLHMTSHFVNPTSYELTDFTKEDVQKAFEVCDTIPRQRKEDREYCFGGVSKEFIFILKKRDIRKIPSFSRKDLGDYVNLCMLAKEDDGITACIRHNVNTFYWGGAGKPNLAIRFCNVIADGSRRKDCFAHFINSVVFYAPDNKTIKSVCRRIPYRYRAGCGADKSDAQEEISEILRRADIGGALTKLAQLYEKDIRVSKICHSLTHRIGEAAYRLFSQNKHFTLTEETAYCAYGFFHGFIEEMLRRKDPPEKAVNFCKLVGDKLSEVRPDSYLQCYHGIGHGVSNTHDPREFGNDRRIAGNAVSLCRKLAKDNLELVYCLGGVYNGIGNYYQFRQYGLSQDMSDPYRLCNGTVGDEHKICLMDLAVSFWYSNNKDFDKTLTTLAPFPDEEKKAVVSEVARRFWREDASDNGVKTALARCRNLPEILHLGCIRGYAVGMLEFGLPKQEYKQPLAFCSDQALTPSESQRCWDGIFSFLPKWYDSKLVRSICNQIGQENQRTRCLGRI